jgi:hypothetical protein
MLMDGGARSLFGDRGMPQHRALATRRGGGGGMPTCSCMPHNAEYVEQEVMSLLCPGP